MDLPQFSTTSYVCDKIKQLETDASIYYAILTRLLGISHTHSMRHMRHVHQVVRFPQNREHTCGTMVAFVIQMPAHN